MNKITIVVVALLSITFTACGDAQNDNTATFKDERLSSFMLGGIFFVREDGRSWERSSMMTTTNKKEIIDLYKLQFEFPYRSESDAKEVFRDALHITNREELIRRLQNLIAGRPDSIHRAWNYARVVNDVCIGYTAGYLTEEESVQYAADMLTLARRDYQTWDEYFADFGEGLKNGADKADKATIEVYGKLLGGLTKGEYNIYHILPLN